MTIKEQILADLKAAMKAGETVRRDTLRLLDSMVKNEEIQKKKRDTGLTDEEMVALIGRAIKQRRESIEQYERGNRPELAKKEQAEIEVLAVYLPTQLDESAIRAAVQNIAAAAAAAGTANFGSVMKEAMAALRGKADGAVVKRIVEEELAARQ